jgi:hypothetical protein
MTKKTAGLQEIFKLYLFTRNIPMLINLLNDVFAAASSNENNNNNNKNNNYDNNASNENYIDDVGFEILKTKFIEPLQAIQSKFFLFEKLVQHVIDFELLPELKISAQHDEALMEIELQQKELEKKTDKVVEEARRSCASFA